jgi:hypothetical protein
MATKCNKEKDMKNLFEILPTGDPYNRTGWDVREYVNSFDETTCTYRGDLSPIQGRDNAIRKLRRMYPGCKIRISRNG